jgi:hypothetical protein
MVRDNDLGSLVAVHEPHRDPCGLGSAVVGGIGRPGVGDAARAVDYLEDAGDPQDGSVFVLVGEPVAPAHAQVDLGGSEGEPAGSPPFQQVRGLGPGGENGVALIDESVTELSKPRLLYGARLQLRATQARIDSQTMGGTLTRKA